MKRFFFFVFVIIGLIALAGFWWYRGVKPVSKDTSYKSFLIAKGSSASQIGKQLEESGLIRDSFVFKVYVRLTGLSKKIFAGEYQLSPSLSLYGVVERLLKGPDEIWVTILEGLRADEVASKFALGLGKDNQFVKDFVAQAKPKEGFLFPDTYLFPKETTAEKIIQKMLSTFDAKVDLRATQKDIILASLIERETKTAAERPIVAGILLNRIKIGMPLQVDATIQYVKGNWEPVLLGDRKINSPFNTYLNPGLPPAPICSPGVSSINAALNPAETDYFYYLHDKNGIIHYAVTLEEHQANVAKYINN